MKFPFEKIVFDKAFWIACVLAVLGWVAIYFIWNGFTTADIIGMIVTVPLLAYLIHVIMLMNSDK
ncbi:MAG TPA: hypothetical protein PK006_07165 [Saprospiraceae bacterium]|nr:hypothetical protein [Saprospiraceae bacterium]